MPINFSTLSNLQRQRRIANPGDPVLLSHGHPGGSARFAIVVYCIEAALTFIGPLWKAPRPMDPKTHLHNFALVTNFSQLLQFLAVRRRHSCLSVFITIPLSGHTLELFAHNQNRHPDRNKQALYHSFLPVNHGTYARSITEVYKFTALAFAASRQHPTTSATRPSLHTLVPTQFSESS